MHEPSQPSQVSPRLPNASSGGVSEPAHPALRGGYHSHPSLHTSQHRQPSQPTSQPKNTRSHRQPATMVRWT